MQRTLSLVLDEECRIALTLKEDDNIELDKFTSHFENSDEIREKFKTIIEPYLIQHQNFIKSVEHKTGKKYRGSIVILEAIGFKEPILEIKKMRVLYKKHLIAFKEMVKNSQTMKKFIVLDSIRANELGIKKLTTPFIQREIRYSNYAVKSQVEFIRAYIKRDKKSFYDSLRLIIKAYEEIRKTNPKLKTIEAIYKEYLNQKQVDHNVDKQIQDNSEMEYIVDGFKFQADEIPYDLDELENMDSNFHPDGLGPIK
ncbi:MAG: hypothetical protein RSB71_03410 [Bacilli bacterium]